MPLLGFAVLYLSSSVVLRRYFDILVNSMTMWSVLKLPSIAWPSPFDIIFDHCSEDSSNLVERPLRERGWDGRRKCIEKKSYFKQRYKQQGKNSLEYGWSASIGVLIPKQWYIKASGEIAPSHDNFWSFCSSVRTGILRAFNKASIVCAPYISNKGLS